MTRVTLRCPICGATARRVLRAQAGTRGVHETESEAARCPKGHGVMVRSDGRQATKVRKGERR